MKRIVLNAFIAVLCFIGCSSATRSDQAQGAVAQCGRQTRIFVFSYSRSGATLDLFCDSLAAPVREQAVPEAGPLLALDHDNQAGVFLLTGAVGHEFSGRVFRFRNGTTTSRAIDESPSSLAIDHRYGTVYVAQTVNAKTAASQVRISILDHTSLAPTRSFPIRGGTPINFLAVDGKGNVVYAMADRMTYGAVEPTAGRTLLTRTSSVCATALTRTRTYFLDCSGKLTTFDAATYRQVDAEQLTRDLIISDPPAQLAVSTRGTVYLANNRTHELVIRGTGVAKRSVALAGDVVSLQFDGKGDLFLLELPAVGNSSPLLIEYRHGDMNARREYRLPAGDYPFAMTLLSHKSLYSRLHSQ